MLVGPSQESCLLLAGLPRVCSLPSTRIPQRPAPWALRRRTYTKGVGPRDKKEKNGYPFTTFTDFSDLGIILRVLSDDLATVRGHNTDFTDSYQSYS